VTTMPEHNHRYLQYALAGRTQCVKCHERIAQGHLRVGASFVPEDQDPDADCGEPRVWITWVHARCYTKQRAQHLVAAARQQGADLKHFLVVPPSGALSDSLQSPE
jgi:hypothetical protein